MTARAWLDRRLGRGGASPAERLALFLWALHPTQAAELLGGLAEAPRREAEAFGAQLRSWDSARRQALLVLELGPADRPQERLESLLEGSPPALRAALAAALPPALRRRVPHLAPIEPAPPLLRALASRLVREALDRPCTRSVI
jgi:hypothetical protein